MRPTQSSYTLCIFDFKVQTEKSRMFTVQRLQYNPALSHHDTHPRVTQSLLEFHSSFDEFVVFCFASQEYISLRIYFVLQQGLVGARFTVLVLKR